MTAAEYRAALDALGLTQVGAVRILGLSDMASRRYAEDRWPIPGPVARAFAWRPLVAAGLVSYGLYLWHWPVFQLLRPRGDQSLLDPGHPDVGLAWLPTLALRLAVTVVDQ